jgi:hypothetical protein
MTPEAMAKYLKEHPGADKANHTVTKSEKEEGKKDEGDSKELKGKAYEALANASAQSHLTAHKEFGGALKAPQKGNWVGSRLTPYTKAVDDVLKHAKDMYDKVFSVSNAAEYKHVTPMVKKVITKLETDLEKLKDFSKKKVVRYTAAEYDYEKAMKRVQEGQEHLDRLVNNNQDTW